MRLCQGNFSTVAATLTLSAASDGKAVEALFNGLKENEDGCPKMRSPSADPDQFAEGMRALEA